LLEVDDADGDAELLLVGWGSTFGAIAAGVRRVRARGLKVAQVHIRHLNPFPANLGDIVKAYDKVLVPEMNMGQLRKLIRAEFLVDAQGLNKMTGQPFRAGEIERAILAHLGVTSDETDTSTKDIA
jgi:2-oxoglutarate ferredoxin oxidoreductase subunit alpha